MKKSALFLKFAAIALIATSAHAASAPAEWQPVHTNEIARWKAERKAPDGVVADRAASWRPQASTPRSR